MGLQTLSEPTTGVDKEIKINKKIFKLATFLL